MNEHNSYNLYPEYSDESPLSANGRFGRLSYLGWNFLLGAVSFFAIFIVSMFFGIIFGFTGGIGQEIGFGLILMGVVLLVFYIALFYFVIIFGIRRLHDLNLSGWLWLLYLVPVVGWIFAIYVLFAPGKVGENDYGLPHETKTWEKVCGWIYVIMIPLSFALIAAIAIPAYQSYVEQAQQQQMIMNQAQQDLQASETELQALEQELKAAEQGLMSASAAQSSY